MLKCFPLKERNETRLLLKTFLLRKEKGLKKGHDKILQSVSSWFNRTEQKHQTENMARTVSTINQKSIWSRNNTDVSGKTSDQTKIKIDEIKIRKQFLWTLAPTALHEITTTKVGKKCTEMNLLEISTALKPHFAPTRNFYHSRGKFFLRKQEPNETPELFLKKNMRTRKRLWIWGHNTSRILGFII